MSLFITGTNTEVGKTWVTGMIARGLAERGLAVVTQKWIQSGSAPPGDDIVRHDRLMGPEWTPSSEWNQWRCPVCLPFPASPHLAAKRAGVQLDQDQIMSAYHQLRHQGRQVIVEGLGGWLVPISDRVSVADWVTELQLPVIVVVSNELGCVNHATLTIESIQSRGLTVIGTVFNQVRSSVDPEIAADNPRIVEAITGIPTLLSIGHTSTETEFIHSVIQQYDRCLAPIERVLMG